MIIHKALYRRDGIDRLHVSRKEGKRGLTYTEDCIDVSTQGPGDYTEKSPERLITAVNNSIGNINTNRKSTKLDY